MNSTGAVMSAAKFILYTPYDDRDRALNVAAATKPRLRGLRHSAGQPLVL
jgi:hypothetical protein